jgi:hypothetical protein
MVLVDLLFSWAQPIARQSGNPRCWHPARSASFG